MKTINLVQGTPSWHEHRANYFNASEAPAMMGASKYETRDELLKRRATGISPDVNESTQRLFNKGHAAEAAVRPRIEALIGDELFPAIGVSEKYTKLSASFDGITIDDKITFECKLMSAALVEQILAKDLEPHYYWQLEQQLLISGAEKTIFVASNEDGTEFVHMEYYPVAGRAEQLIAGWDQFEKDLAEYKYVEPKVEAVGKAIDALPTLSIQLVGEVKQSNLAVYKKTALDFIASINTNLQTDQHFADAENVVKFCDRAEKELEVVKKSALSQTASIDELFRTVDSLKEAMRSKRLELEKLVKARKESIRVEMVAAANVAFGSFFKEQADRLGGRVPAAFVKANFTDAIKGKKTIAGLRDGINDEMARAKIEASTGTDKLIASLAAYDSAVGEYDFLFRDLQSLVLKNAEAVTAIVAQRISEHKQAEEKRLEAERQRIAQQERERIEREERVKIEAEQREIIKDAQSQFESDLKHIERSVDPSPPVTHQNQQQPTRPTDAEIVGAIASRFGVTKMIALKWLAEIDLKSLAA